MTQFLLDEYDALLLDLDGTVYRGGVAVDGAAEAVTAAHRANVAVRYVTNNASRRPEAVAEQLTGMGLPAKPGEVSTSSQAAAGVLADRLPAGAAVLVVGTDALADEIAGRGLTPVRKNGPEVAAVVQGLSQDVGWRDLAEACLAIRAGALWVASNVDPTLPTDRGELPGNGSLVAALRTATNTEPVVAGKPARPLMDEAIAAAGGSRPLVVGDRLDTDVAGAHAVGIDSLAVLTGVSTPAGLLAAGPDERPTYLAADLSGVLRPADEVRIAPQANWTITIDAQAGDQLVIEFTGDSDAEPLVALRAACAAWWAHGGGPVSVRPVGPVATNIINELRLA
jgi:HAD superfamily hydrolase (TIGR01450 family)